jgi:DNA-directed RNA polymerase subunit RPC12/RpoP
MPIRFRCVYCDKLLGIARRKAGAVVNCPHCSEKLIVPTPEAPDEGPNTEGPAPETPQKEVQQEPAFSPVNSGGQLFERSDFEALLQPEPTYRSNEPEEDVPSPAKPKAKSKQKSGRPAPLPLPPNPLDFNNNMEDVLPPLAPIPLDEAPQLGPASEGIYISRNRATWLSVIAVLALAGTFALGVVVGKLLK